MRSHTPAGPAGVVVTVETSRRDHMRSVPARAPGGRKSAMDASGLVIFALFIALMYFMLIRPQQKRQKEVRQMLASLTRGDDVITIGGLHGRVHALADEYVDLEVTDDLVLRFQRSAIAKRVVPVEPSSREAAEA
ncbi:MAG: preprotein translocase subunit YajC [Actinomycetota bacterium]|nr:preprotein translocase subunit YajC [Actinomycetota bacterium]